MHSQIRALRSNILTQKQGKLKQKPYSYHGYVDARIPTDDEAQFGGGLNYQGGAALPSRDDDEVANEVINDFGHHHEPTGVVEVDILWEQLEGYAEISDPLDDHDLPVFWHIRECINFLYLHERTHHMTSNNTSNSQQNVEEQHYKT